MNQKQAVKQLQAIKKIIKGKKLRLAAEWDEDWKILISTILSAQTKDEVTIDVCEKLFAQYSSLRKLSHARLSTIEKIIRRVNYHKTKARHISATAKCISQKGIPKTLKELMTLPGVGRKVGNVYLAEAHKSDVIGVDTHVARISYKLGWSNSKNPHKIEKDLENLFPKKYWRSINEILVTFGRIHGKSRREEDGILNQIKT